MFLTNFLQTSYKLLTNFLQTSNKLLTNFLQTSYVSYKRTEMEPPHKSKILKHWTQVEIGGREQARN
jgi:hypothetical protein